MEYVDVVPNFHTSEEEKASLLHLADVAWNTPGNQRLPTDPFHYMIMGAGVDEDADTLADPHLSVARSLAKRMAAEFFPELDILSVRLLISPVGCDRQLWHLDWVRSFTETRFLLLPVGVPFTAENSLELLDVGGKENTDALAEIAKAAASENRHVKPDEWQHLSHLQKQAKTVPLLLDSWQLALVKNTHAFHRRGRNVSNYARVTFNMDMGPVAQKPGFVDIDLVRSKGKGRLAPWEEIDNLEEEDAVLDDFQDDAVMDHKSDKSSVQQSML
jgi:hypothetical protein